MDFYNDNEPTACQWLYELMQEGHLPKGIIDERPIQEITESLANFRQCHFFAGIGGWPLALRLAGWPADRPVWTGSCPCQPFSTAGKRKGEEDERHVWPFFYRLIRECRPATVFGEQVASSDGYRWLAGVQHDLEAEGYAFGAADMPACSQGSPQIRQRLFWVADAGGRDVRQRGHDLGAAESGHQGEGDQRQRIRADAGDGSEPCGVAGARHGKRGRKAERPPKGGEEGERGQAAVDAERCGGAGGLGVTELQRAGSRVEGIEEQEGIGRHRLADSGQAGWLGGADSSGREQLRSGEPARTQLAAAERGSDAGFWDRFTIIPCRDGKYRRIEPESFPLAPRLSGRVAALRGYGNSISPQTAAAFIRAFLTTADVGSGW